MDISKDIDKLNHKILLFKLEKYRTRGPLWNLIKSYIINNKQFLLCKGFFSQNYVKKLIFLKVAFLVQSHF